MAQIWAGQFFSAIGPPVPARYHACLYAKSEKYNDSNSRKWPKTPDLDKFGHILPKFGPNNLLKTRFWPNLGLNDPNFGPKFVGQHKKPPFVVKYH